MGACVILSAALTGYAVSREADMYTAKLGFQIASASNQDKPDLQDEKNLLLSNDLILQVLKDINEVPSTGSTRFRGLDLGQGMAVQAPHASKISELRNNLIITFHPENSALEISIQGKDPVRLSKIISEIFEKFSSWRRSDRSGFDQAAITADSELSKKRDEFIQSQQAFLSALANADSAETIAEKKKVIEADLAALKLRYGPKHPAMIEAQKRLDMLSKDNFQSEQAPQIAVLKSRMEAAFESLDTSMRQAMIGRGVENSTYKILPLGNVEVSQNPKHVGLKMTAAALMAFLASLFYLAVRARIRPVIHDADGLQKTIGANVLDATKNKSKNLRHELKLQGNPKLIVVTSGSAGEGRAEFMVELARNAARGGEKVLIMDADLREPELQKIISPKNHRNLVDYLSGQSALEDVIMRGEESGLHAIYGTAIPNTALDIISSEKMKTLLLSLREAYDLVLVQAPPASKGLDARILGAIADKNLYLVRKDITLKQDLIRAGGVLKETRQNLVFVLKD